MSTVVTCAGCNYRNAASMTKAFRIGTVRGRLCVACEASLGVALAGWMHRRLREVELLALRADEERDAALELANEALPLSTRRAMRRSA